MVDREGQKFAEMSRADSTIAKMLHQLEVQLARLTCRLGCSKEHVLLFHKALLLFYKTYAYLRSDLRFEQKFQVRSCHALAACCFYASTPVAPSPNPPSQLSCGPVLMLCAEFTSKFKGVQCGPKS